MSTGSGDHQSRESHYPRHAIGVALPIPQLSESTVLPLNRA